MKKGSINDKRVWLAGIIVILLVSTITLFAVTVYRKGNVIQAVGSIIVTVTILVFAVLILKR